MGSGSPLSMLLAVTLWHLTGKAEIITLINLMGHCISYSRVLEALTAICVQTKESQGPLPPNIVAEQSELVHFWFDNFNLQEETSSGKCNTHTTHGLLCQEKSIPPQITKNTPTVEKSSIENIPAVDSTPQVDSGHLAFEHVSKQSIPLSTEKKVKIRSKRYLVPELPPCYVKKKVVPPRVTTFLSQSDDPHHDVHQSDLLWVLARYRRVFVRQDCNSGPIRD